MVALETAFLPILQSLIPTLKSCEEHYTYFPKKQPEAKEGWMDDIQQYRWKFDGECAVSFIVLNNDPVACTPAFLLGHYPQDHSTIFRHFNRQSLRVALIESVLRPS